MNAPINSPMSALRTLPSQSRPPAQPRIERVAELLVIVSAATMEILPIFCWLLMLAAYDTGDPNNAGMPFWWMLLLILAVRWLGVLFTRGSDDNPRRRRRNTLLLTLTVAVLGPFSLFVTYWLSPAAHDFLTGGSDTGGPVALALLVAWLWWRGLSLSRGRVTRERMYIRFIVALGVTIAALAGGGAVQGAARDLTASYLSLLLALLLFVGPMGLTLAQARDASYEMRNAYHGSQPVSIPPVFTRSWLAASLGLSLGLSLLALILTTLISRQSVRVLAIAAGNVVSGLIDAVQFILTPIFVLLYLILNKPIEWLADYFHRLGPPKPLTLPTPAPACKPTVVAGPAGRVSVPASTCAPSARAPTTSLLPAEWLTVMRWGAVILIVVVALVMLARVLSRYTERRRVRAFSEERTMLDAREILGGQLRHLFNAFRRRTSQDAPATDDLAVESVRRVYRDTLAAAGVGHARRAAETPHEYQRRITSDDPLRPGATPPPDVTGALGALTSAYEVARYGQPDSDSAAAMPAPPETVHAAETVRRWLAERRGESRP